MIDVNRLYTTREVASMLGVNGQTIRKYCSQGNIKRTKLPFTRAYVFKGSEVMKLIEGKTIGEGWMTARQVAEKFGVTQPTITYWVKKGWLKYSKKDGERVRFRFRVEDVEEFEKNHKKRGV